MENCRFRTCRHCPQVESLTMPGMTMTTRRASTRNLQQLAEQDQAADFNEDQDRDYDLNCERAMQKKAKACNVSYLVTGEEKGGNQVFSFSTAMYELYKCKLLDHFNSINDNPSSSIKAIFKDATEKSGIVVESQIKVHQRTQNGCGRQKYTVNMYHTNNRIMVNGRHAVQFNVEHNHIAEQIVSSEQVAQMDQNISSQIQEGLKEIIVNKTGRRTSGEITQQRVRNARASTNSGAQSIGSTGVSNDACTPGSSESVSNDPEMLCCPTCNLDIESKHSICCDQCEVWFHAECENVDNGTYERLTATDVGYMCLSCLQEVQTCENLSRSLIVEERNQHETGMEVDSESTHRKEGYEPGPVARAVPRFSESLSLPPIERMVDSRHGTRQTEDVRETVNDLEVGLSTSGRLVTESSPVHVEPRSVTDRGRGGISTCDIQRTLNSDIHLDTPVNPEVLSAERNQAVNSDKQSKPQKKGGRQKVKETEQEEQLKLARSLINNLERKLGEVQNSNKILRQELNIIKSERDTQDITRSENNVNAHNYRQQGSGPVENQNTQIPHLGLQESPIVQLREQIRTLEFEMIKNRLNNIEAAILQQRQYVPGPPTVQQLNWGPPTLQQPHWGPHLNVNNWYPRGGIPAAGQQPGPQLSWNYSLPQGHHQPILNPIFYQGQPLGVPGYPQQPQPLNLPGANLVFRNNSNHAGMQKVMHSYQQGPQIPVEQRQAQHPPPRTGLVFRNGAQRNGTLNGKDLRQPKSHRDNDLCVVESQRVSQPPQTVTERQTGNATMETRRDKQPTEGDSESTMYVARNSLPQGTTIANSSITQQLVDLNQTERGGRQTGTPSVNCEGRPPTQEKVYAQIREETIDLTTTSSPNGNQQLFLESGRASEKKWKRRSC